VGPSVAIGARGVDGRAIAPTGHQAVLHLGSAAELTCQEQATHDEQHDQSQTDEGPPP
jgi:hypothetical protein